jgi:hypothetical protein
MAEQDRAGRLTGADDAHVYTFPRKLRPLRAVFGDTPAVIVGDVDRFRPRGVRGKSQDSIAAEVQN